MKNEMNKMLIDDEINEMLIGVVSEINGLNLRFTNKNYTNVLLDTYRRTIMDIRANVEAGSKILEIGCFNCVVSVSLKRLGYEVCVCDIPLVAEDKELIDFLRKEEIDIQIVDLASLPLPYRENEFDAVICCEVIEHLPFNPIPVFKAFAKVLSSGGIAYIATPNLTSLIHRLYLLTGKSFYNPLEHFEWQLDPNSSMSVGLHWKEYTKKELLEFMGHCGFKLRNHYFFRYVEKTQSKFIRRKLVSLVYSLFPQLMQGQVGVFERE